MNALGTGLSLLPKLTASKFCGGEPEALPILIKKQEKLGGQR
jgi:hypothetical protein